MKLSYFHSFLDVPEGRLPEASVVIDVLRATTTIACALNNGAEAIQTFESLETLRDISLNWPSSKRILLGERGGKCLDGFDLGNSPLGVSSNAVKGKRLFMSTTNGTRALDRVGEVENLYTLSLPNRRAIGERLLKDNPSEIWILGSGWEGTYSLEDTLGAGSLIAFLLEQKTNSIEICNDELTGALAVWKTWKNDLEGCLRIASHGQRLALIGNHDDDFACCSQLDTLTVVPKQVERGVLRAT